MIKSISLILIIDRYSYFFRVKQLWLEWKYDSCPRNIIRKWNFYRFLCLLHGTDSFEWFSFIFCTLKRRWMRYFLLHSHVNHSSWLYALEHSSILFQTIHVTDTNCFALWASILHFIIQSDFCVLSHIQCINAFETAINKTEQLTYKWKNNTKNTITCGCTLKISYLIASNLRIASAKIISKRKLFERL